MLGRSKLSLKTHWIEEKRSIMTLGYNDPGASGLADWGHGDITGRATENKGGGQRKNEGRNHRHYY